MSKDIKLSPKYGFNPTVCKCFWCGNDIGVGLLGKLPNDAEAPRDAVVSYDPCEDCQEKWDAGITVLEVNSKPNVDGQPPLMDGEDAYPTGRYAVFNRSMFDDGKHEHILEVGFCLATPDVWAREIQPVLDEVSNERAKTGEENEA